jgi:hypothetical protein
MHVRPEPPQTVTVPKQRYVHIPVTQMVFSSESCVIPPAVQECKDYNIKNHNSTICFVWV